MIAKLATRSSVQHELNWSDQPIPPRLTPSPPPFEDQIDEDRPPTPPLRMSIFPHPLKTTWHVNVVPYDSSWSVQFESIRQHLSNLFLTSSPPAPYLTTEHVGSTSVPGIAAKPNIDILVTFSSTENLNAAIEALNWEVPTAPPFAKYTLIPRGGGIPGRESYKIYLPPYSPYYATTPERSVYLIADVPENLAGRLQIRCYRTVRDVLRSRNNEDLLEEYGRFKMELGRQAFADALEYSAMKDGVIRKILLRGGWTAEEVNQKEMLTRREWVVDGEEPY